MSEYLSVVETAKLVRAALKRAFPGVKFSVRSDSYAGGASIDIRWTDGPSSKAVKDVTGVYAGGRFDGMIDMKYSVSSWLMPDGSAAYASSPGSACSAGLHEAYDHPAPAPGARKVRFGADFVFCNKEWSVETYTAAVEKVCAEYGVAVPPINVSCGSPFIPGYNPVPANEDLGTLVHRELAKENYA